MALIVISVLAFVAMFVLVRSTQSGALKAGWFPWLHDWADFWTTHYDELLKDLFITGRNPRVLAYLHVCRHLILFLVGLLAMGPLVGLVLAILAHFLPGFLVREVRKRRWRKFDDQIVDSVSMLSSSVRAGLSLVQSLDTVAQNMSRPSNEEFRLMASEYKHGHSLIQVLDSARRRIPTDSFNIVATAILVNREKGGNLTEVLEKISESIREISRLEKKILTETSSVRFSAKIMMAMPAVIGLFFYMIEPDSIRLLFTHPLGNVILVLVVLLNLLAYLAIRKIVSVEL
ncbi:MAG: hypothetical protein EHM61_07415 [Acidobacteria bacterium]|nr:MAG: hypothetical protein EHM61_07415 [Acidobacteriota bacterium]